MKFSKCIILFFLLLNVGWSSAQERPVIKIPDILTYQTLKCDFHLHSVLSDGQVWPTVRIDEAWRDGLDVLSITDHIEYRPNLKYFSKDKVVVSDHNLPYEIAREKANEKDVLLIKGAEITRTMPPGHCNALFLTDINPLDTPWKDDGSGKQGWMGNGLLINNWKDAFYEAKKQGAFIFWNHPGWKTQQPDTTLWWQEHTWLFENHLMDGIEVVNGNSYSPEAHQWAIEKNLTMIAGSDAHGPIGGKKRPVTLVFATDRSVAAVKEALFDHRSAILSENKLFGDRKFLDAIFFGSITIEPVVKTAEGCQIIIQNSSDISFELSKAAGNDVNLNFSDKIIIPAGKSATLSILMSKPSSNRKIDLKFIVDNFFIAPGEGLPVTISLITNGK